MARTRKELLDYIASISDPGAATDEELQGILGAYDELKAQPEKRRILNQSVISEIAGAIKARAPYISDPLANQTAEYFANRVISGNTSYLDLNISEFLIDRGASEMASAAGHAGGTSAVRRDLISLGQDISKIFGERQNLTTLEDIPQDFTGQTKSITDIQGARTREREKNAAIDELLADLPDELSASREEFLSGEYERAGEDFRRYIPRAQGALNAKGLLFSGDVEDELTSSAIGLQGGLEALEAQITAEDNQFYFDAAYQNALRKQLGASSDYKAAIENERAKMSTEREQKFKSYQSDLDRILDEQLKRSDLQRQEDLNRSKLRAQRDAESEAERGQLFSEIARTGISVGTTRALGAGTAPKSVG